jgi:hypothetical protein
MHKKVISDVVIGSAFGLVLTITLGLSDPPASPPMAASVKPLPERTQPSSATSAGPAYLFRDLVDTNGLSTEQISNFLAVRAIIGSNWVSNANWVSNEVHTGFDLATLTILKRLEKEDFAARGLYQKVAARELEYKKRSLQLRVALTTIKQAIEVMGLPTHIDLICPCSWVVDTKESVTASISISPNAVFDHLNDSANLYFSPDGENHSPYMSDRYTVLLPYDVTVLSFTNGILKESHAY